MAEAVEHSRSNTPAAASVARTLQVVILAALALLIWTLSDILLLVFLAALIAVMLRDVSDWAARRTNASPLLMLAVVTVMITLVVIGLLYYLGPRLVSQIRLLIGQMQQTFNHLKSVYGDTPWGRTLLHEPLAPESVKTHIVNYAGILASSRLT